MAIAVLGLMLVASAHAAANCKWTSPTSNAAYDLSGLAGNDILAQDSAYKYNMNVCGGAAKPAACTAAGSVYQAPITTGSCHMLATWDATGKWNQINADPNAGVSVQFNNGDSCTAPRQVTINFACGPGSSTTYTLTQPNPSVCSYIAQMTNSYGCPAGSPNSGGGGGSKGLSGGSVFLIIFFVGFFVYVVAGCIYKRTRMGTSGMESCPNIDFWRDLPALIRDGFRFTWAKLRGLCGGGGDGHYEGIK